MIIHENYDGLYGENNNDIAIIVLESSVLLSNNVQLANQPSYAPNSNELVNAVGWGQTETGETTEDLMYVTMPILDQSECQQYLKAIRDVNSVVCLVQPISQGTCHGDSGGPFYLKDSNVVVGIVSFGFDDNITKKCMTNMPSVGTNVYFFLDWINEKISSV